MFDSNKILIKRPKTVLTKGVHDSTPKPNDDVKVKKVADDL